MYHLFPLRSLILSPSFPIPSSSYCYPPPPLSFTSCPSYLFISSFNNSSSDRLSILCKTYHPSMERLTLVLALQIAWYKRRRARRSERRDEIVRTRNKEIREVRVQAEIKSSINIVTDRRVEPCCLSSRCFLSSMLQPGKLKLASQLY